MSTTNDKSLTPIDHPRVVVTGKGPNLCYGVCVEVNGKIYTPEGNKPIALCACGLSALKPLCDGAHKLLNDHTIKDGASK